MIRAEAVKTVVKVEAVKMPVKTAVVKMTGKARVVKAEVKLTVAVPLPPQVVEVTVMAVALSPRQPMVQLWSHSATVLCLPIQQVRLLCTFTTATPPL
ncbi:hypothetical protein ES703_117006 [subsurface metagenome]